MMQDARGYLPHMIRFLEELRDQDPQATIEDLISRFRALESAFEDTIEKADCRNCGHPIEHVGGRWQHATGSVGCRSASFDRYGDWDDSFDRKWQARPPKK